MWFSLPRRGQINFIRISLLQLHSLIREIFSQPGEQLKQCDPFFLTLICRHPPPPHRSPHIWFVGAKSYFVYNILMYLVRVVVRGPCCAEYLWLRLIKLRIESGELLWSVHCTGPSDGLPDPVWTHTGSDKGTGNYSQHNKRKVIMFTINVKDL